jgi:hypothetical protein
MQDNRDALDHLGRSIHRDSVGLVSDARTAIEEVRREVRMQGATANKLAALESRLGAYEASILSAGEPASVIHCLLHAWE